MAWVSQATSGCGPRASAIIPLYNKRGTIGRAIASVLAQKEPRLELIVVDDGSSDGSADIVQALGDPRIRLIRQANQGPGRARNFGAAVASAPLLAFLDADDEWTPEYLSAGLEGLSENSECVAYVCGYDSGDFRDVRPNKVKELGRSGPERLATDHGGPVLKKHVDALHSSCVIVRTGLFRSLGGYYGRNRCRYGEDSYLWLKVLLAGPICWDPRELVRFHVEDSSLGYAGPRRTSARPISLDADALLASCPPEYAESLRRLVGAFVDHDMRNLRASGALREVRALRRLHKCDTPRASVIDLWQYAKATLRRATAIGWPRLGTRR